MTTIRLSGAVGAPGAGTIRLAGASGAGVQPATIRLSGAVGGGVPVEIPDTGAWLMTPAGVLARTEIWINVPA